jgi:hypothetical protein
MKNPLVIGAVGVGALWLYSRSIKAAAAARGPVRQPNTQEYHTPTAVAADFARSIVALTKNLNTTPTENNNVKPAMPTDVAGLSSWAGGTSLWNRDSSNMFTSPLGDPQWSWSAPQQSSVGQSSAASLGSQVDQVPAGPLYDLSTDFVNNPWVFGPAQP